MFRAEQRRATTPIGSFNERRGAVSGKGSTMLIWSGWGFLVAFIWAPIVATSYNSNKHLIEDAPFELIAVMLFWSFVTSVLIWLVAALIRRLTLRTLIDQRTGLAFTTDASGSFFFIPTRFWAYLIPIINLALIWANWR